MEQGDKRRGWVAIILLLVAVVCSTWVGIGIGRGIESSQTKRMLGAMSEDIARYNEFAKEAAALEEFVSGKDKMMQTVLSIRSHYVDPISLDTIYEKAIPKILSELDPHSEYIPAKIFEQVNESLEGEFDGIGIVFNAMTDTITVLNVIPQGPSDKAGVRAGDRVMLIDGREVAGKGIPQDSMVRLMRGPRGSKVTLSVKRSSLDKLVDITITRAAIEMHSVEASFMLDAEAGIGYVRLSQFSRTSYAEVRNALDRLKGEGMQSVIIDLRGNGGGFLDQVVQIVNELLPAGKLIVYTEDRHGQRVNEFSNGKGQYADTDIVVLVDEFSASSSEILAGAVQDNDRGLVIGRRTFGKGLVQAQIPFNDGSAMRLTVARYYTPTGRSIQKPYVNGDEKAYQMDLINRINHHELFSADSIHFDDSMKFTTPAGRTVYGGGGIMPDIFIPIDTMSTSDYYNKVWDGNVLYRYTMEFTDRHRKAIDNITSLQQLDALLSGENLVEDFVKYAERNGVARDEAGLAKSRKVIEAQIRAYIGRNTMNDESGFYYNIFAIDDALQRAVEEIKRGNTSITK
ncbi:MAG: S41 family peptidase [Alistipes sp.]|jgi:carboxyl-terminal processing protease|nr:S41 family peptidase [Alistipes sp.]MEE1148784.1 S41 family peptidase [Alistipes sp.]